MWVKTVNRQFRMMNSVLFRKVDYRTLWSFNPETRSQPQTSPFQWGLLEEVPHLSVTVCETQRAFLSRLLFKFFFSFLTFPLPALGEAVSNSRWGPEAGCTVGSWVCPSSRPLSSPSSHPGPFLGHTPTGPSWVVRPAKDTDQTWATSYILFVFWQMHVPHIQPNNNSGKILKNSV